MSPLAERQAALEDVDQALRDGDITPDEALLQRLDLIQSWYREEVAEAQR